MTKQNKHTFIKTLFFLVPSCLGLFFFLTPLSVDGKTDIPVGYLARNLLSLLQENLIVPSYHFSYMSFFVLGVITLTFLLSLFTRFFPRNKFVNSCAFDFFRVSPFWLVVRSLGFLLTVVSTFQVGPSFLWSLETGGFILNELLPFLFCLFFCAGFLLPLLLDFGLLEFFGVFLTKVMRPLFTLPGRSSIDCLSSWVGDGGIAIFLTNKQYEEGFYNKREATVIATTFSFVSITFCFVVLSSAGLQHLAMPYYLTILIAGFVAAIICPRVPPLSWVEESYYKVRADREPPKDLTKRELFSLAFEKALSKAETNATVKGFLLTGLKNVIDMWTGVLMPVMCFGSISLIIAKYTSIFKYLGLFFYPFLLLLQVPEAYEASQAIVIGFTDMFLPVLVSKSIESDFTRFVIAAVSVSQLIFMSEAGSILLTSKMNIRFKDLVLIFILRTLITLPIVVLCAHFIF